MGDTKNFEGERHEDERKRDVKGRVTPLRALIEEVFNSLTSGQVIGLSQRSKQMLTSLSERESPLHRHTAQPDEDRRSSLPPQHPDSSRQGCISHTATVAASPAAGEIEAQAPSRLAASDIQGSPLSLPAAQRSRAGSATGSHPDPTQR